VYSIKIMKFNVTTGLVMPKWCSCEVLITVVVK
jgi:hypothetical protein